MARIDYFNDPNAPKANSIVPSVTAIVPNDAASCCWCTRPTTTCGRCPEAAWT